MFELLFLNHTAYEQVLDGPEVFKVLGVIAIITTNVIITVIIIFIIIIAVISSLLIKQPSNLYESYYV